MSGFDVKEYQSVILAALLHDVGKFMQRAEVELAETSKGMESTLCPVHEGRYSHKHVLWTDHFFENCIELPTGFKSSEIGRLSAIHHRPDSPLAEMVTTADRYSSGMDRDSTEPDEEMGKDAYKRRRMRSIFESVCLEDNASEKETIFRYELMSVEDDLSVVFPTEQADLKPGEGELLVSQYMKLWEGFSEEARGISTDDFDVFYTAINQLLMKYTWCIPSSTVDYPDISLYDHLKTTAAIAACLYKYHSLQIGEKAVRDGDPKKFLLLVGDLSGIQNYIFNITHIGAGGSAKRLRARSFTVAMMAEITAHKFIRRFDLTESNILIASGGKFYLLLPNIPGAAEMIAGIEKDIAEWLYKNLNAEIGLNIATLEFAGKEFCRFNELMKEINIALQQKKQQPFAAILKSEMGWVDRFVHEHADFQEEEKLCKGCGRFPGEMVEGKCFCRMCKQDKEIGQALPKSRYLAFYDDEKSGRFQLLGHSITLLEDLKEIRGRPYLASGLGDWAFSKRFPVNHRHMAYHIPLLKEDDCRECDCREKEEAGPGQPMMFECIAKKSKGRDVLAYLKADVDRLGEIFAFGLGQKAGISRIATMSRMLDLFFAGYVETTIKEKHPHVYTVYSGGDDLLMIGPWNEIVDFAAEMYKEFRRFTCWNPNITLSAGIILAKPRMPVFRSVEMADAALDEAKEKPNKDAGRDQLWLFGDHLKWEKVNKVLESSNKLSNWIESKGVSVGFARNLLTYGMWKKEFHETGDTRLLRYLPLMTYDISRNLPPPDKDRSGVRVWAEGLKEPDSLTMKHMGIVANYALTANRGGGDGR